MSNEMLISDTGVLARAELDIQISTAKAYPRNVQESLEQAIALITMDQDTAESCFYCLARNGKDGKTEIKGPSIRLAEITASCWGNLHAATRIVENDGSFITAEGCAWDLQKNVKISTQVKRSIKTRDGKTYGADMQGVTGNAAASIALRNAILKVIPKALIDRLYDVAVKYAVGDQKTLDTKRKTVISRLEKMGIDKQKILTFFGKQSIEEFTAEDVANLIGIGTAIKDGMQSIDAAFSLTPENEQLTANERIKLALENKQ